MFIFLEPLCSVLTSTILLQKLAVIHLVYKCNGMIYCSSYEYPHAVLKNVFSEHFWFPGSHVCTISFVRNITHFKCIVNPPPPTNTHTHTQTHTQNLENKINNFWKQMIFSHFPCKKTCLFFKLSATITQTSYTFSLISVIPCLSQKDTYHTDTSPQKHISHRIPSSHTTNDLSWSFARHSPPYNGLSLKDTLYKLHLKCTDRQTDTHTLTRAHIHTNTHTHTHTHTQQQINMYICEDDAIPGLAAD